MQITAVLRNYRRGLCGCAALASAATLAAVAAGVGTGSPPAQAAVSHRLGADVPGAVAPFNYLNGVSTVSPTDAWAAGDYNTGTGVTDPLIVHWNGTAWKKVTSSPPSGSQVNYLHGVSAVSPTDAWAVGSYENSSGVNEPLILQCNGKACKQVASPLPTGAAHGVLEAVNADSRTDAWAVGLYINSSGVQEPLLLHWNGTAWSPVGSRLPSGTLSSEVSGVSADSPADAWAVGSYENSKMVNLPLLLRWNGTAWSRVTSRLPSGTTSAGLSGVSADSPHDTWAAGDEGFASLTLHWNGTMWKPVASRLPSGAISGSLSGVSAVSPTDAWAVGTYQNTSGPELLLVVQCNGKSCKQANSTAEAGSLSGVSADSAADAWAVGDVRPSSSSYDTVTFTEHWNGTAWTKVKSPNGT